MKSFFSKLKNPSRFSHHTLAIFLLAFGLIGYFIYHSFAAGPLVASLEAEQMTLPAGASVVNDSSASGGQAAKLTATGTASGSVSFPSSVASIAIKAKGGQCSGAPSMTVKLDSTTLLSNTSVSSTSWTAYTATPGADIASGTHSLSVSFNNAYSFAGHGKKGNGACTRSLYVDVTDFYGPTTVTPAPTVALSASPTSVTAGQSATLTWSSTNATSCTASGTWSGTEPTSGSISTGALNQTSTYSLTCTGAGGSATGSVTVTVTAVSSGTTYYVDCGGSDNNNGISATNPWKSLSKANNATLNPGDSLLLKRGCTWNEQLIAKWNGSSGNEITIGAYGTGANPLIQRNAGGSSTNIVDVAVTGSYQLIENIQAAVINPYLNTTCLQSDGTAVPDGWYVDFSVDGSHNTLTNLDASSAAVGIDLGDAASYNRLLNNHLHGLHYLWQVSETSGALGAMGINLHGNYNEAAYNLIEQNGASCTFSDGATNVYSAAFEVYNANGNYVHHNVAYGHKKHFEMGHDSTHTTNDNVLAYNLFVSNYPGAVGPNIHGSGSSYGPVNNTQIYNNTIVFTGANSQAIVCGCSGGATIKNNILIAEWKSAYYSGTITETNNLYWDFQQTSDSTPDPFVQFSGANVSSISPTSIISNPLFVNFLSDYHLQPGSPAINTGTNITTTDATLQSILSSDLDKVGVPQGAEPDMGAYEYH